MNTTPAQIDLWRSSLSEQFLQNQEDASLFTDENAKSNLRLIFRRQLWLQQMIPVCRIQGRKF